LANVRELGDVMTAQTSTLEQVFAPFSPEQVQNLNEFQCRVNGGMSFHPFTCQNRGDGNHGEEGGDRGVLIATEAGWVCPHCDYTQNWAHANMAKKPVPLDQLFKNLPEVQHMTRSMQHDIVQKLAQQVAAYQRLADDNRRGAVVMLSCLLRRQAQVSQDARKELNDSVISMRVDVALANTFRLELAHPNTGQPMTHDERRDFLTRAFQEIAAGMGLDRFTETPVERMDQYAVMTVLKNHDTAGLLRSLVNSFMIAYACPETADAAFDALLRLEAIRAQVANMRGQPTTNASLRDAAIKLNELLCTNMPWHSVISPRFIVLEGADRLFVMSPKPIKDLPGIVDEWIVEWQEGECTITAH